MNGVVMRLKEIGGYFEFENYNGAEYHYDAIALNCAANCLAYLIKAKKIKKLYIPYFLCRSIKNTCLKYKCDYEYYNIDICLRPIIDFKPDEHEYIYIVNYYGQLSVEEISSYKKKYINIIIDDVQNFFGEPVENIDTLYGCRKYFGVPDGAYLYTDKILNEDLATDISYARMTHIIGRYEEGAQKFYDKYAETELTFAKWPIKRMSKLTHNLLRGIDYAFVKDRRTENFKHLHNKLEAINNLGLTIPEGAFMYPLYIGNGVELKKKLIQRKIFVPTLWGDVFEITGKGSLEYDLAENIVPLPIDQRYDEESMKYIIRTVKECL